MKIKKVIAIATAAAFAVTGTAYADTGVNLATEGSDVTAVIEDISLMGDRIEADDTAYYTGDITVNFSLFDEEGISSVAILHDGETLAEKKYDTSNCIETADGEVMNAESTIEAEGADAQANTSEPITTVSDSLVISTDTLKELEEAKATEAEAEEPAAPVEEAEAESSTEAVQPEAEVNTETETEAVAPETAPAEEAATEPAVETSAEPEAEAAVEPEVETAAEPEAEATEPTTEPTEPEETADPTDNTFTAEMVVTDVNDNVETKEFDFNTAVAETPAEEEEAVDALKAAELGNVQVIDANTFRVEVNLTSQIVTVYQKNLSGGYDPIRAGICSTGRSGETTPTGTFTIGPYKTKCGRSRWALMSSGKSYAQYLVRFHHGICFHSVIYSERGNHAKMKVKEYNKLGTIASAGCVRMQAIDVKWIYDHCPNGTKVKVYRSSTPGPLPIVRPSKLPTSKTYSWDPSDPDTGNPFRGGSGKATGVYVAWTDGLPMLMLSPDLAYHNINFTNPRLVYNGKNQRPGVKIYGLTKDKNFTVEYPATSKYVGKYTVEVNGIGSFTGCNTATYQIIPKSTKIKSLKKGKKKFKVKYKKVKKQITGYQIMYSKSSKFKDSKTSNVKGYKKTSRTIKVGSKGTYYVKVRVYKTVGKDTIYSNWSKVKKVKVK